MESDITTTETEDWMFEEDVFNPYETMDTFHMVYMFVHKYIISSVKILLCIFIIGHNGLLSYVIIKFKGLQTRTNYIVLNFALCCTAFSISSTLLSLGEALETGLHITEISFRVLITITHSLADITFLLAFLLATDWFISAYFQSLNFYQKIYRWLIVGVYCFLLKTIPLVYFTSNVRENIEMCSLVTSIISGVTIVMSIIIRILKNRIRPRQESVKILYALYISNVYFAMWFPLMLMIAIYLLSNINTSGIQHFTIIISLSLLTYVLEILAFVAPIVIFFMLRQMDTKFRKALDSVFRKSVWHYVNEDIDNEEEYE